MDDESYIDLYTATDEETGEETEGMIVKGKDVVMLNAPEVLLSPETPLLTEAQDVAGAINELFGLGAKGGDFRAIADNGEDSIYVNLDTSDSSGGANCAYKYFDYSESITTTTTTTVGDTTTTTENTVTFTKRIITELTNIDTETLLLQTSYDESTGEIHGYTDRNGTAIYVGGTEVSAAMSGNADIAAIAWVLAKNIEQASSFDLQIQAYKKGLQQGVDGGADIVEEYEEEAVPDEPIQIEIRTDEDGRTTEPFIGSLVDGLYYTDETGAYVHMWLDMSYVADGTEIVYTGQLVYDAYDSDGNLIATQTTTGSAKRCWKNEWKYKNNYGYIYKVKINGSKVTCYEVDFYASSNFKPSYTAGVSWSPSGEVADIMANAVKVSNVI